MGIKERIPLINSDNKGVRIVGYVFYASIIITIFNAVHPPDTITSTIEEKQNSNVNSKTVDVDGYTFTADLGDQWETSSNEPVNESFAGFSSYKNWEDVYLENAFWLPRSVWVHPQQVSDLAADARQKDLIAVVGIGVYKVPKELQGKTPHYILLDTYPFYEDERMKDIKFNDRPALLIEKKNEGVSGYGFIGYGSILILMTNDTVVSVDVKEWPEFSDLLSWDVIEKFTITPK